MLPKKLTFIDVETTGTSFRRDRVIEIGIVQTDDGKIVKQFSSLINPQQYIPTGITNLTGISAVSLENAPTFREVHKEIKELLEDSVFVAHNAAFDYGFIKNEFKLLEQSYSSKCLCTVKLSRSLFPEYKSHNLDTIIDRFNISCENRHRALDDALVMVEFVKRIYQQFSTDHIEQVINRLLKRPSNPVGIIDTVLDSLPEVPGVYIFYGNNGIPLYIGKSNNIKSRVLSHFSSASVSTKELEIAAQVTDIETIVTEGELGALLKEADLIKEVQPIYNKQLRSTQKLVYLGSQINSNGYKEITFSSKPTEEILGIFKTQKQAKETLFKISEEYDLCKKLLGIEKTASECFGYQLGKCKGACANKENVQMYNLRLDLAFIQTKIKSWPFNGPVIISEGSEKFIVDNWRYKKIDETFEDLPVVNDATFDIDTYKILSTYVYSEKNTSRIQVITKS